MEKTKSMNSAEFKLFLDFPPNWFFLPILDLWKRKKKLFLKNVFFIACKWCKIYKYYVHIVVISLSPVKRKKKNAFGLNIWFLLFCRKFKFVVICAFFPPNLYSQNFRVHRKIFFPSLWTTCTQQDIQCLPYAGFFLLNDIPDLEKKHFLGNSEFWEYRFGGKSINDDNLKVQHNSLNQIFNPNAFFFFLLTGDHDITMLYT